MLSTSMSLRLEQEKASSICDCGLFFIVCCPVEGIIVRDQFELQQKILSNPFLVVQVVLYEVISTKLLMNYHHAQFHMQDFGANLCANLAFLPTLVMEPGSYTFQNVSKSKQLYELRGIIPKYAAIMQEKVTFRYIRIVK